MKNRIARQKIKIKKRKSRREMIKRLGKKEIK